MSDFPRCITFTMGEEGGFTIDESDPGNWTGGAPGRGILKGTRYGISAAAYPKLDIKNLTLEMAEGIYERDYWRPVYGDYLHSGVNLCVFDMAVNAGVRCSVELLQAQVGAVVDGEMGPHTLDAANALPPAFLVGKLIAAAEHFYQTKPEFEIYGKGWLARVARRQAAAVQML